MRAGNRGALDAILEMVRQQRHCPAQKIGHPHNRCGPFATDSGVRAMSTIHPTATKLLRRAK